MVRIEMKNVNFGYSEGFQVLHDINLVIDGPGLTCIIGPNGVGKSTLIKCINKLIKPTSGTVLIDGQDVSKMSLKELSMIIGYVPVHSEDCFAMNVVDNILVGRHNHSKWKTTDEDMRIVNSTMRKLGIQDLAMRNSNELSAGQHQKVAIARGLVQEPKVLILDEPTSNLDVKHQIYVTQLLRALAIKNGLQILMISHDLNIASKYANKVIVMAPPGRIIEYGDPNDVITESVIEQVYGVRCTIVEDEGRPHVILKSDLPRL